MNCRICKSTENLSILKRLKLGGIYYICRECNTQRLKKYRSTTHGKEATKKAVRRYESNNPVRKKAWGMAQCISMDGGCEICGSTPTHRHHPDITKPLRVVVLCPAHHKEAHRDIIIL